MLPLLLGVIGIEACLAVAFNQPESMSMNIGS